jgi:hypothetical protein
MTNEPAWVPDACTLPTAEQPVRIAEFDALFATARRAERLTPTRLRVSLAGPPDLLATTEDLTERETRCCSFFAFTVTEDHPGTVVLDVEVPPAHTDVLDALSARADRSGMVAGTPPRQP